MAAPAPAIRPEDKALVEFLTVSAKGLDEENQLLTRAKSRIHSTSGSIYFAYFETVYAYLVRRSLALNGFRHQISYEQPYPSSPNERVDLQISSPCQTGTAELCAVEMKWVCDEGDKALGDVLNDITKLIKEPGFQRRFVLLMPMCNKDGTVDAEHFAGHLQEFRATCPTIWLPFGFRVLGERRFESNPHDFTVALIEISPA